MKTSERKLSKINFLGSRLNMESIRFCAVPADKKYATLCDNISKDAAVKNSKLKRSKKRNIIKKHKLKKVAKKLNMKALPLVRKNVNLQLQTATKTTEKDLKSKHKIQTPNDLKNKLKIQTPNDLQSNPKLQTPCNPTVYSRSYELKEPNKIVIKPEKIDIKENAIKKMINAALRFRMKTKIGVASFIFIKQYITSKYGYSLQDIEQMKPLIRNYIKHAEENRRIIRVSGRGLNGCFRLFKITRFPRKATLPKDWKSCEMHIKIHKTKDVHSPSATKYKAKRRMLK